MAESDCKFCAVARGETEAMIVYENDDVVAFLDHRPLFHGHCLLIPRKHIETLGEMPAKCLGPFFSTVQRLARAVEKAMGAEGNLIAINNRVSQSVPHLHVHVVPRSHHDGLRGFLWPRHKYPDKKTERDTAKAIRAAMEKETKKD